MSNIHFFLPDALDWHTSRYVCVSVCMLADDGERSENDSSSELSDGDGCQYELIGVTVHTGTADGGHYYSFIRDRLNKNELGQDRWYVFPVPLVVDLVAPCWRLGSGPRG